eukprot:NODE_10599_length_282_cov_5.931330_g8830_i0.p3 GENE.NODE_10599_length_282_cov_5.931330_g8830_i0~~NODE_10599_length_282_cov_5.931330_g8830_i0.p3  ORF type:complete len:51 (+),score=12.45 NODE_10599_length_282_cov_5.931330_g8830_i0:55-207(+)
MTAQQTYANPDGTIGVLLGIFLIMLAVQAVYRLSNIQTNDRLSVKDPRER